MKPTDQNQAPDHEPRDTEPQQEQKGPRPGPIRTLCLVCGTTLELWEEHLGYAMCCRCRHPKETYPKVILGHDGRQWLRFSTSKPGDATAPLDAFGG